MSKNDGGAAFPDPAVLHSGMSLRDYFAATALRGLISSDKAIDAIAKVCTQIGGSGYAHAATISYEYADAMLVERDK